MSTTAVGPSTILNQIRISLPGIRFYRWGMDWYEFSHAGNLYHIPPDLPGHPKIKNPYPRRDSDGRIKPGEDTRIANGEIEIKSRFGNYIPMVDGVPFRKENMIYGQLPGEQAEHIAAYIVEKHGPKGVLMLTGDPKKDADARNKSREIVLSARRQDDEALVAAYRERRENWERHPNKSLIPPPRPTPQQKAAQVRLDALREAGETIGRYICPHGCAVETNDWDEYARHMMSAHGIPAVRPAALVPDGLAPEVAARLAQEAIADGAAVASVSPLPKIEALSDPEVSIPAQPTAGRTVRR